MSEFVRQIERGQELKREIRAQIEELEKWGTIMRELTWAQTSAYRLVKALETITETLVEIDG